jgi:hypothetical protein
MLCLAQSENTAWLPAAAAGVVVSICRLSVNLHLTQLYVNICYMSATYEDVQQLVSLRHHLGEQAVLISLELAQFRPELIGTMISNAEPTAAQHPLRTTGEAVKNVTKRQAVIIKANHKANQTYRNTKRTAVRNVPFGSKRSTVERVKLEHNVNSGRGIGIQHIGDSSQGRRNPGRRGSQI